MRMPSRSHLCRVFVVLPTKDPNSFGEYVCFINTYWYICVCFLSTINYSLFPPKGKVERNAGEVIERAELAGQILLIAPLHEAGMVDKEDKARRVAGNLGHIVDAKALAADHGRVAPF